MDTASFLFRLTLLVTTIHVTVVVAAAAAGTSGGSNVTYDGRSLIIDGQRRLLFSGSIHYPRSTPEMWPSLISKAKEGGLDVIQTYVFWNLHEPQQGKYDFSGRRDLVRFIKEIRAHGLLVCLRIGPYIESEWTYGGLPFWLHDIPGIVFRSDNEPFKFHMQRFVTQIVNMMKSENLFASQGGPIILSQIENEYKTIEAAFRNAGPTYVRWAAQMAVGLQTGVPWLMCKQDDAPDPVINACNGMRCGQTFAGPNSPNKPSIWTENWTSFYQAYGAEPYMRSPEDIAFHVALFIAKNGSYVNYYMYHGGTNFGRSASAFMITGYYDQAPLDEYGLIRQPKFGHLQKMHLAIKLSSKALLYGTPSDFALGPLQHAFFFKGKSGECAAFLVNNGAKSTRVKFQNLAFDLPGVSISILPDCKTETFNTAKVNTKSNTRKFRRRQKLNSNQQWQEFKEAVPSFDTMSSRANTLLDQISTTKDTSDYLWYTMRIHSDSKTQTELKALSHGHILHVFLNGLYIGSATRSKSGYCLQEDFCAAGSAHGTHLNPVFNLQQTISLKKGDNYISFLSVMVGLPNSGAYLERKIAGLHTVTIQGRSYTNYPWGYQVGLSGERKGIHSGFGNGKIQWNRFGSSASRRLIWYKTVFDAPPGNDPVVLNLGTMGKGEVWINGQSIGRYWVSFHTARGSPSQTWYHIPRSFLKSRGNLLILLEEESGNPLGITVDTVTSI